MCFFSFLCTHEGCTLYTSCCLGYTTKGLVVTRSESLARAWSCFCSFFISFRFFHWNVQFFSFRFQLLFSFRSFGCRFRCMSEQGKAKEGRSPQQCRKRW